MIRAATAGFLLGAAATAVFSATVIVLNAAFEGRFLD